MDDSNLKDLDSEEGQKRAESLFSKKFMDYLTAKRSTTTASTQRNTPEHEQSTQSVHKEGLSKTPSSDETSMSDSSGRMYRRTRRPLKSKQEKSSPSLLDYNFALRHKVTQCSLIKNTDEIALPEELKPLMVNMTLLLQELQQAGSSGEYDELHNLISRITILINEFSRRTIKPSEQEVKGEHTKNLEKYVEIIFELVNDYKSGPDLQGDDTIREYKRMEKEVAATDMQINEVKKKLARELVKSDTKVSDVSLRVYNSILNNERLKAEIKFNQGHLKKYKKTLLEKEWMKHKLDNELIQLKKKVSKDEISDEGSSKQSVFSKQSVLSESVLGSEITIKSQANKSKTVVKKKIDKVEKVDKIEKIDKIDRRYKPDKPKIKV